MSSRSASTQVSSAEDRKPVNARVRDLLDQQAALRDLAVAVAEMRAPEVIYELVAKQAARIANVDSGAVVRFRVDRVGEIVGSWHMGSKHIGSLLPLDGAAEDSNVSRAGRSARSNGSRPTNGKNRTPPAPDSLSLPRSVSVPIRVRRELWGSLLVVAGAHEQSHPIWKSDSASLPTLLDSPSRMPTRAHTSWLRPRATR